MRPKQRFSSKQANAVEMPRVNIVPSTQTGVIDVVLSKPGSINVGNPSAFPLAEDAFKNINYQSASQSELNVDLAEYYSIMNKIMAGTSQDADLNRLTVVTTKIRDYVLTDDDYNLVVGALQKMQSYILKFMYTDITNKAKAMDNELNKVISDINRFMIDLETLYSKSPSDYPIPNNSVLKPKLSQEVVNTLDYAETCDAIIVADSKPSNPSGRGFIWYNTGVKL